MNQFFEPHGDVSFEIPRFAFARFEQCEPLDLDNAEEMLLIFSAVSADWYEKQKEEIYSLAPDSPAPELWAQYWRALFNNNGHNLPLDNPYENMPLLRYEICITVENDSFDHYREIAKNENDWLRIVSGGKGPLKADVYGNLFGVPQTANVLLEELDDNEAHVLSSTFDMNTWPDASETELESALNIQQRAVALAAFDVGQGSASALLDDNQVPWLYHDLGAGVTRNAPTTPKPLKFCWSNNPTVILSHWDSDHWAGALKDSCALDRTWIVPRQVIGVTHTAFANSILLAGGRILIWAKGVEPITVSNSSNQSVTVGRCTGNDRNGSCLAMRVDNVMNENIMHWLLTGDGGYHQLPFSLPGDVVVMAVPHHGAKMAGNRHIPKRVNNTYARLLFSFGPGNTHGRTSVSHPCHSTVYAHEQQGWNSGTWKNAIKPGYKVAGGDVLATSKHASHHLGGVIAGWVNIPTPTPRPCGNAICKTDIKQS